MNIALIYFSGTGNTLYVGKDIQQEFQKYGVNVDIFSFDEKSDLLKYDLIGFGYPIYAFNIPKKFWKSISKRIISNKRYFIFKTSGETLKYNNCSSRFFIRQFKKKKCKFIGEYHFAMPYNIIFRFEDSFVKEQLIYEKKLVTILVHNILEQKVNYLSYNTFHLFISWLCRLVNVGAKLNSKFYRIDKKKCNECHKCVSSCPFNNIYLNKKNKIKFSSNCQMCMRCSFYCPRDAIKIGLFNNWKVNGDYHLDLLYNDSTLDSNYIEKAHKKFYRCFKNYFFEIDKEYLKINRKN